MRIKEEVKVVFTLLFRVVLRVTFIYPAPCEPAFSTCYPTTAASQMQERQELGGLTPANVLVFLEVDQPF